MRKFKHQNREYDLFIGFYVALQVFPPKFNIYLTKLLSDMEKTTESISAILLDDEKVLSIMWHYIEEQQDSIDYDTFLKNVTPRELAHFREEFWEEVINFSGPLKAQALKDMMKVFRKELKNMTFESLVSESPPEESVSETSPSEN